MNVISLLILGVVQGFAEFLPVSSSGHLAILEKLMGIGANSVAVAVVLHLGTLLALLFYFFKDIIAALRDFKMLVFIAVVTVITGVVGVVGKHFFEGLFASTMAVGIGWLVSGTVLWCAGRRPQGRRDVVDITDALVLGGAQACAIAPGVSRSGATMSALVFCGIERVAACRISFIAGIPAIAGAAVLECKDVAAVTQAHPGLLTVGFAASFICGLVALRILRRVMQRAKLHYFGVYCFILGVITLIFLR